MLVSKTILFAVISLAASAFAAPVASDPVAPPAVPSTSAAPSVPAAPAPAAPAVPAVPVPSLPALPGLVADLNIDSNKLLDTITAVVKDVNPDVAKVLGLLGDLKSKLSGLNDILGALLKAIGLGTINAKDGKLALPVDDITKNMNAIEATVNSKLNEVLAALGTDPAIKAICAEIIGEVNTLKAVIHNVLVLVLTIAGPALKLVGGLLSSLGVDATVATTNL